MIGQNRLLGTATLIALIIGVVAGISSPALGAEPSRDSVGVVDTESGVWYLREPVDRERTSFGETDAFSFGNLATDKPLIGDWNCDGIDTVGVYRPSDGYTVLSNFNSGFPGTIRYFFGDPGDIPIAGDFDGDGCDTVSTYRPSEGRAFIVNTLGSEGRGLGAAEYSFYFGNPSDKPFVGDFDGDGVDTLGLHRRSTGQVFLRNSNTQGIADTSFYFGNPGDVLIAGDWAQNDAGAADTIGIYRPSDATFYLRFTNTPGYADFAFLYGNRDSIPVVGDFDQGQWDTSPPPNKGTFDSELVADPGTGECLAVLTWDWDGPLWADMRIWQVEQPAPATGFSDVIDSTGEKNSHRVVFDVERSTYHMSVVWWTARGVPLEAGNVLYRTGEEPITDPGRLRATCG